MMPAPLVIITTDRAWFHVDVYVRQGQAWVKQSTKTFETTLDTANQIVDDTMKQNPDAHVNGYVYDTRLKRWKQWR